MDIEEFYKAAAGFSPNPLQQAVWNAYYAEADENPAILVKAGTGTGKTEAILFPALADPAARRIILVLPSKALIEDMGERIKTLLKNLAKNLHRPLNLTVDMGGSCRRFSAARNGTGPGKAGEEWQTFHRHLFADDIIVTTLDKFLFRLFGYGEKIKSYIFPHRVFGTSLGKRPLVIFDEAHEYDGPAFSNFTRLIEALYIKGKALAVMSATLPEESIDFLETVDAAQGELAHAQTAFQFDQQGVVSFQKRLELIGSEESGSPQLELFSEKKPLITRIAEEADRRYDGKKRIIVRMESVRDVIKLHERLKGKDPLLYHGRLTTKQRKKVITEIIRRQQKDQGFLVLATSAIEAGCDLDAHLIITQLCNPDSLVQLAGRLNRRGRMKDALLVVVGDSIPFYVNPIDKEQLQRYLEDLRRMNGRFQPEMLKNYFRPPQGDWMGEILFDMLWEYVYEGDLTSKRLWDRGILVTRSWEPAVTLCTGFDAWHRPKNPVQIGVSRLAKRIKRDKDEIKNEQVADWLDVAPEERWHAKIYRAFYNSGNPEESRWRVVEIQGKNLSCYETSLICCIEPDFIEHYYNETLGYTAIPRIFMTGYREGFKQYLNYQPKIKKDGCFIAPTGWPQHSARVWYLDRKED